MFAHPNYIPNKYPEYDEEGENRPLNSGITREARPSFICHIQHYKTDYKHKMKNSH